MSKKNLEFKKKKYLKKDILKIKNKKLIKIKNPAIDPKRRRLFETSGVKILPKIQNKKCITMDRYSGMQKVGLH